MSLSILVIPDTHCEAGQNMDRADWIGKYIADTKPTHVIHLGDLVEMASLSFHDLIKEADYEGDCASAYEFQDRMRENAGVAWNEAHRTILVGNHEARIHRTLKDNPHLKGAIGLKDLGYGEYFNRVVDWSGGPGVAVYGGVRFAHFFQNRMGRAIGGVHHARTILLNNHQSSVCGHSHQLNYHSLPTPTGKHLHALVAGCCFTHHQDFAGQSNQTYWRGIAHLHDVRAGEYDLEMISIHRLKKAYK